MTAQRLPRRVLASLQLSGQVERIVAVAPALLTVTSATHHEPLSRTIATEVQELNRLVAALEKEDLARPAIPKIKSVVTRLRVNLDALNTLVGQPARSSTAQEGTVGGAVRAHIATQRLLTTGIAVMDAKIANARRTVRQTSPAPQALLSSGLSLDELLSSVALRDVQSTVATINHTLLQAALVESVAELQVLAFPLRRSLSALETATADVDTTLRQLLAPRIEEFRSFVTGPRSILDARTRELDIVADGERLLAENRTLSAELTEAVEASWAGRSRTSARRASRRTRFSGSVSAS